MKRNGKATFLMALLALAAAKGAAIEREGEILFEPSENFGYNYPLDLNGDMIDDCAMNLSYINIPINAVDRLLRYLTVGTRIIFEDDGLRPNQDFGAGRMIGFIMSNGNFVRLDQMFSEEVIQQYFPRLWAKIQAEQRGSR